MSAVIDRLLETEWTVESLRASGYGELPGWELLDGRLEKKMGKNFRHYNATRLVFRALDAVFGMPEWCVFSESPVQLGFKNLPEPDVSVVSRQSVEAQRDALPEEVRLLVEISSTTQAEDFGSRLQRYAHHGIGEYWVLDVAAEPVLHIYTEPDGEEYVRHVVLTGEDEVPFLGRSLRTILNDGASH